MDEYTENTRRWLEGRFSRITDKGVYFAHQPIYGFRDTCSEGGKLEEYIRSYRILKALAAIRHDSLLDVGGAEGFTAYLAKHVFGKDARSCDLSEAACRRAREILGINSEAADIHDLPYEDGRFDAVVCSETLEHVNDLDKALGELLRVAGKAVIITVPMESAERVEENRRTCEPHAHIHSFTLKSFDALRDRGFLVNAEGVVCAPFVLAYGLIEGRSFDISSARYPDSVVSLYRYAAPFLERSYNPLARKVFGDGAASAVIRFDGLACRHLKRWKGMVVTIVKDREALIAEAENPLTPGMLLSCKVPHYYVSSQPL